jgi:hypothetical protein
MCALLHRAVYDSDRNTIDDRKGLRSYWVQYKQDVGIIAALYYGTNIGQVKGNTT